MTQTIRLSIQEILNDFENCVRSSERLNIKSELGYDNKEDEHEYLEYMIEICEKYIPNYKNFVPERYFQEDENEKGIILESIVYKNFKEMFYGLIQ